jgi:hypothetical protein
VRFSAGPDALLPAQINLGQFGAGGDALPPCHGRGVT